MVSDEVLVPVKYSVWSAPIVCVKKSDGSVRICVDFKVSVNPWLSKIHYQLPLISEMYSRLSGCTVFVKLDLKSAFNQLPLSVSSRQYTTISTPFGLYQYTVLPFGLTTAPALFQRVIDQILCGLERTAGYLDDILVGGIDLADLHRNLQAVMHRLDEFNVTLNLPKCVWLATSVCYLGHVISGDGITPDPRKLDALAQASAPRDVKSLRSFLGFVNYYCSFVPHLAEVLHPLHELLKKGSEWSWTAAQEDSYQRIKAILQQAPVLIPFDPGSPVVLITDASDYGIGAILAHRITVSGSQQVQDVPIAFALRHLSSAEMRYSQIEKEALSIIFGMRNFHHFLFGIRFTLVTDHKPLPKVLGPAEGVPKYAANRLTRWALTLAEYDYAMEAVPSARMLADFFSREPSPCGPDPEELSWERAVSAVYQVQLEECPLTPDQIRRATRRDATLQQVSRFILSGWP